MRDMKGENRDVWEKSIWGLISQRSVYGAIDHTIPSFDEPPYRAIP